MGLINENGSIEIVFPNKVYSPGETVTGTVRLNLAKPIKARALKVAFFGNQTLRGGRRASRDVFTVEKILSGSREYKNGETCQFAIQIPGNIVGYPVFNYFIKAYLDLPAKLDILKISDIQIDLAKASNRWAKGRLCLAIIGTVALSWFFFANNAFQFAILIGALGCAYSAYIYFIGVRK